LKKSAVFFSPKSSKEIISQICMYNKSTNYKVS
jgi:hypothetical protein